MAHGKVGRLAVRAPSVTSGYWNDSALTHQTRVRGFWLTGDLAYCDSDGWFYHVDRTPDVVRTNIGPLYSLAAEELILKHCPDLSDCTVFAQRNEDSAKTTEQPIAIVRLKSDLRTEEKQKVAIPNVLLNRINTILGDSGFPSLVDVHVASTGKIPLGATGKVLKRQLRMQYAQNEAPQEAYHA